jgi:hypothetical protein
MVYALGSILGLYMTISTLVFTVWGVQWLQRKRGESKVDVLQRRVTELERAVTRARTATHPQDNPWRTN